MVMKSQRATAIFVRNDTFQNSLYDTFKKFKFLSYPIYLLSFFCGIKIATDCFENLRANAVF